MKRVVLAGSLATDQIMKFDGSFKDYIKPDSLDTLSISVLLSGLQRARGGIGGNIAYSLALLHEKPILLASVGEDQRGYIDALSAMGVDTTPVHFSSLPTASFCVMTDSHHCQVGGFYPGATSDSGSLSLLPYREQDVLIVISAHDPTQMVIQIEECKMYNLPLCFDVGQQVIALPTEAVRLALSISQLLIVNEYEMQLMARLLNCTTDEVIRMVPLCITTLGDQGSLLYDRANDYKLEKVAAVSGIQVVDPTGAGDAFRAGFFYGYLRDWPHQESVKLGSVVASYAIENHGTQAHTFTNDDLEKRFLQTYHEKMVWKGNDEKSI